MSDYYVSWKGVVQGPFGESELKRMIVSNTISKMHLISNDKQEWTLLSKSSVYMEIAKAFAPKQIAELTPRKLRLARREKIAEETIEDSVQVPQAKAKSGHLPERLQPPPLMDSHQIQNSLTYAGFWLRVAASLIDCLVIALLGITAFCCLALLNDLKIEPNILTGVCGIIAQIAVAVSVWLYYVLMESSKKQATLGKWIFGICVATEEGGRISFARANRRYFAKILSAMPLCLGYLMVALTSKKQGLHDMLSGCVVINAGTSLTKGNRKC